MIGNVPVRTFIRRQDLCTDLWTLAGVRKVLDMAMDEQDEEARHCVQLLNDQAHRVPIELVQAFLGEARNVTRGTIGEPHGLAVYVTIIKDALETALVSASLSYFDPPLSTMESSRRCMAQYMFVFIERD